LVPSLLPQAASAPASSMTAVVPKVRFALIICRTFLRWVSTARCPVLIWMKDAKPAGEPTSAQ
jgi:hypothetical protein